MLFCCLVVWLRRSIRRWKSLRFFMSRKFSLWIFFKMSIISLLKKFGSWKLRFVIFVLSWKSMLWLIKVWIVVIRICFSVWIVFLKSVMSWMRWFFMKKWLCSGSLFNSNKIWIGIENVLKGWNMSFIKKLIVWILWSMIIL